MSNHRPFGVRLLVLTLVALFVLEGLALAASFTAETNLKVGRRPRGPVEKGTSVRIIGKLHSPKPFCRRGKRIQLIRIGKGVIASRRTNFRGRYRFDRRVFRPARFRTRFRGSVSGVHPNIKTCLASTSRVVRVRVVR